MAKQKKQTKPRIITSLIKQEDEIVELVIKDVVKPIGRTGYVSVPKELIGKYVTIIYKNDAPFNLGKEVKTKGIKKGVKK